MAKEIKIDGILYIPKTEINALRVAKSKKNMNYCIVRTYSAGVFAGYVKDGSKGKERIIYDARRIWYWKGASSLSELAMKGTVNPKDCKFPIAVPEVELTEVIEVIKCTDKAQKSIESVEEWKQDE